MAAGEPKTGVGYHFERGTIGGVDVSALLFVSVIRVPGVALLGRRLDGAPLLGVRRRSARLMPGVPFPPSSTRRHA